MTALAPIAPALDLPGMPAGRWLVGGVAAELAGRLRASVELVRLLMFLALVLRPSLMIAYALAALLIPRGTRRLPSWPGAVALGRLGVLFALPYVVTGGVGVNELGGPGTWVPLGALTVAGLLVLVASAPSTGTDEERFRTQALGAAIPCAVAVALAAGTALVPGVRWELAAAVVVAVLGGVLALAGGRSGVARAAVTPAAVLAIAVLLVCASGARLQGGVGDQRLAPSRVAGDTLVVRRAAGNVVIDLRRVRSGSGVLTVRATVGIGDLRIVVPRNASVVASLHAGRGRVYAGGRAAGGLDVALIAAGDPPDGVATKLRVRIEAEVGIGEVDITRERVETEGRGRI